MTKQYKPEVRFLKQNRPKVKPVVAKNLSDELAGWTKLLRGPIAASGDGSIETQATRLRDPRLQTVQRQDLATRIGRMHGNKHLQRVTSPLKLGDKYRQGAAQVAERTKLPHEMIPGYAERFRAQQQLIKRQPVIQLKKIDYRQLTWNDFQGKAPKKTKHDAMTASDFLDKPAKHMKKLFPVPDDLKAVDTEKECKIGAKKATKFSIDIEMDPYKIEVKPYMDQGASWRKSWTTDKGAFEKMRKATDVNICKNLFDRIYGKETKNATSKIVKQCRRELIRETKNVAKLCRQQMEKCRATNFTKNRSWIFDDTEVTSKGECKTVFFPEYKRLLMKDISFSQQFEGVSGEAKATTIKECGSKTFRTEYAEIYKKSRYVNMEHLGETFKVANKDECSTTFLQWLLDRWELETQHLLKHEQGHFDITAVEASRTEQALRAQIASFPGKVTACGTTGASTKAKTTWKKQVAKLIKTYKAGVKSHNQRQKLYDKQTIHSQALDKQVTWTKELRKEIVKLMARRAAESQVLNKGRIRLNKQLAPPEDLMKTIPTMDLKKTITD